MCSWYKVKQRHSQHKREGKFCTLVYTLYNNDNNVYKGKREKNKCIYLYIFGLFYFVAFVFKWNVAFGRKSNRFDYSGSLTFHFILFGWNWLMFSGGCVVFELMGSFDSHPLKLPDQGTDSLPKPTKMLIRIVYFKIVSFSAKFQNQKPYH